MTGMVTPATQTLMEWAQDAHIMRELKASPFWPVLVKHLEALAQDADDRVYSPSMVDAGTINYNRGRVRAIRDVLGLPDWIVAQSQVLHSRGTPGPAQQAR